MKLLLIQEYAKIIGLHPQTLRKLERDGKSPYIKPTRTPGNHRRYAVDSEPTEKTVVGYARVSCADQKEDLPRQVQKLTAHSPNLTVFKDTGSGLNCKKPGLRKLVLKIISGTVSELVLTYKDRLLRFGSELIFLLCEQFDVKVTVLDVTTVPKTAMEIFCEDVLAILTVFSAKLYGSRSHVNRNIAKAAVLAAKTQLCSV